MVLQDYVTNQKKLYLHYHNVCGYQSQQCSDLGDEFPRIKLQDPFKLYENLKTLYLKYYNEYDH